jgi:hypothetical protein
MSEFGGYLDIVVWGGCKQILRRIGGGGEKKEIELIPM